MRKIVMALTLISMAGCMAPTMNQARQEGPYKILYSKKTDKDLAQCVQYEWQNQPIFGGAPGATLQPGKDNGFTVFTTSSEYFVDIQPGASGSVASYYVVLSNWIAKKRLTALESCL